MPHRYRRGVQGGSDRFEKGFADIASIQCRSKIEVGVAFTQPQKRLSGLDVNSPDVEEDGDARLELCGLLPLPLARRHRTAPIQLGRHCAPTLLLLLWGSKNLK